MNNPSSSSSSPFSVRSSPPSEYPQSIENSSQEPYSDNPSSISSPPFTEFSFPSFSSPDRMSPIFNRRSEEREPADSFLSDHLDSLIRDARCAEHYIAWNACVEEELRTGRDLKLRCYALSRIFRDCVRYGWFF